MLDVFMPINKQFQDYLNPECYNFKIISIRSVINKSQSIKTLPQPPCLR